MKNKINIKSISTEARNDKTNKIDIESTIGMLKIINNEDKTVPLAVEKVIPKIAEAVDACYEVIKNNGGRVFYIGAGTSGRLGVLDASEMPPTFNVPNDLIIGIIAGGDDALRNPIEGAEDSTDEVINDLSKYNFNKNDILIGIAASGRTPYVISGIEYAKEIGAKTISISTSSNSKIGMISEIGIDACTGAETITGSTRMKSGTAQKLILNMISSSVMIKLGKVYQNWMIDVKASNEKLFERVISMVIDITNVTREEALSKLEQCNYSPKIAVVMIIKGIDSIEANDLITKNDGRLSNII